MIPKVVYPKPNCSLQCRSLAGGLAGSETLLSQLGGLETSLNTLLHTIFPGMFQQLTATTAASPLPPPSASPPPPTSTATTTENSSLSLLPAPHQDGHVATSHSHPSSLSTATAGLLSAAAEAPPTSSSKHSTPQSDEVWH